MMTQSLYKRIGFKNISTYLIIFIKVCYYEWANFKNMIQIRIFQVYLIKSHSMLSQTVYTSFPLSPFQQDWNFENWVRNV